MIETNAGQDARSGMDVGEGSASADANKDNQIDLDTNVSKDAPNSPPDAGQTGEDPNVSSGSSSKKSKSSS